mmetsp:Transcript_94604/g.165232  ORF Transcript_94604/g.165232 Transcript_94604/m.165232 type:complete len:295 (+) Transcript_94604:72-956(+)
MAKPTTFVLSELNGKEVTGEVDMSAQRDAYDKGEGSLLSTQLFTSNAVDTASRIRIPLYLNLTTLEAIKDHIAQGGKKASLTVCIPHSVQPNLFLKALDFLGLSIEGQLEFETISVKCKYQCGCHLEPQCKSFVTEFLQPALFNADLHHGSQTVILFDTTSQKLRSGFNYQLRGPLVPTPQWSECFKFQECTNFLVFASIRETRMGEGGVKMYKIFEVHGGWWSAGPLQEAVLESAVIQKEASWHDDFDATVASFFTGSFQQAILRMAIADSLAFKDMQVDVLEHQVVVLTCTW